MALVAAKYREDGDFKILDTVTPDEEWEFLPNQIVSCQTGLADDEHALVANSVVGHPEQ